MAPRKDEVNGKQEDGGGVEPRDGAERMDDAQVSAQLPVLPLTTQEPAQPPCPAPSVKQSENQHCLPELNHRTTEPSPLTLCPLQFIMVLLLFISFLRTIVQVNNTFLKMFLLQENDRAARKPSSSRV